MSDNDKEDNAYDWSAFRDDSGQIYYHNRKTNETSWELPPNNEPFHPVVPEEEEEATDDDNNGEGNGNNNEPVIVKTVGDWTEYMNDENGESYYYNNVTLETVWERPAGFDEEIPKDNKTEVEPNEDSIGNNSHNVTDHSPKSPVPDQKEEDHNRPVASGNWVEYKGDDGLSYFFNEKTEETVWERPSDFQGNESNNQTITTKATTTVLDAATASNEDEIITMLEDDIVETADMKEGSDEEGSDDFDNDRKKDAGEDWIEFKDDDGRSYFSNQKTEETVWDRPAGFVDKNTEQDELIGDGCDGTSPVRPQSPLFNQQEEDVTHPAASGNWVDYKDDKGRTYFYNEKTQEVVWDRPPDFNDGVKKLGDDVDNDKMDVETELSPVRQGSPLDTVVNENDGNEVPMKEESVEEEVINPAVKRLEEAKEALSQPDAIMETDVLANLIEVIKSDKGIPKNAIQSLSESAHGQTAVCGLLSRLLVDLKSQTSSSSSNIDATAHSKRFQKSADEIREMNQEVVNRIVKERFTHKGGDSILALSKSEAAFLEDMMDSNRWRKLLIDLSATNKDSALLTYCLQAISERGYHREIARRINQSEHFPVFNAMLASELAVIGKISVSACYDHDTSISLNELVNDLRRTCTSTTYTYMYAFEVLRFQIQKANGDSLAMIEKDRLLYARIIRKWERLLEVLQGDMIDPSTSLGFTPLFRKRRLDVACTISDLHQRQRRRLHPGQDDDVEEKPAPTDTFDGNNKSSDDRNANVESGVLAFLKRYGLSTQIDASVLDQMLPVALGGNEENFIGNLLVKYPIAIEALLGYLYKPEQRVGSVALRKKCARLVGLAVLAAEKKSLLEAKKIEPNVPEAETDEVALTKVLLEGCQLCEQLENMVSFIVTADSTNVKGPAASPGERLCSLAFKYAPVSQGVAMWSREITKGVEFVNSASYATISPNIMSLVRIIYLHHPFTRDDVCGVAIQFLKHSNSEVIYQTMNSLKEQSLRLLIYLCIRGEAPTVFDQIMKLLKDSGRSPLDASLIRYFISGLLEVVRPPFSIPFIRSFLILLKSPASVDAVKTSYFNEKSKNRLEAIMNYLKTRITVKLDRRTLAKEDTSLINSILSIYQLTDEF